MASSKHVRVAALLCSSAATLANALVQLKDPATATSFADALYETVVPSEFVIRLFHRSGWTGSHTVDKLKNESQALYPLATADDLATFTTTDFDDKKAVFVNSSLLSDATLFTTLGGTDKVSAVFVQYVNATVCEAGTGSGCEVYNSAFSSESPLGAGTPSAALNPDPDHAWVPDGSNTVLANFSFPIYLMPDQESSDFMYTKALENQFTTGDDGVQRAEWPYIAAEPHLYLGPKGMNSTECLTMSTVRDGVKYCDPLGGQSVWAAAKNAEGKAAAVTSDDAVVLVGAAMDVRNLVQSQAGVGADQTVSALVAMMVAADTIAGMDQSGWNGTRVVFAAFEAERYGFLGSRRFLNDLFTKDQVNINGFPGFECEIESASNNATNAPWCVQPFRYSLEFTQLNPYKISHVITVDGVGTGSSTDLYMHSPTSDETFADQVQRNVEMNTNLDGFNVQTATTPASLPPTPLSSAVEADLPALGVAITGYDDTFTNQNYMGPGDVRETLDKSKIGGAAAVVVEAVLAAVGVTSGSSVKGATVNATLVDELVACFLGGPDDPGCALYDQYAYIYPSYDRSTKYTSAPNEWIGSPSTAYGTYTLYTGVYSPPYFYRAGSGWDPSYTQVNWLHRVGTEFVPFDDEYEYNADTDSFNVPTSWSEYFVWSFFAQRFGEVTGHETSSGDSSSACDSYEDCGTTEANMACINAQCVRHFAFLHDAVSTALTALDYQVYQVTEDPSFLGLPVYAEPVWGTGWWDTPEVRMFIPVNPTDEWALFGMGVVVLLASSLFVYFRVPGVLSRSRIIID